MNIPYSNGYAFIFRFTCLLFIIAPMHWTLMRLFFVNLIHFIDFIFWLLINLTPTIRFIPIKSFLKTIFVILLVTRRVLPQCCLRSLINMRKISCLVRICKASISNRLKPDSFMFPLFLKINWPLFYRTVIHVDLVIRVFIVTRLVYCTYHVVWFKSSITLLVCKLVNSSFTCWNSLFNAIYWAWAIFL